MTCIFPNQWQLVIKAIKAGLELVVDRWSAPAAVVLDCHLSGGGAHGRGRSSVLCTLCSLWMK